MPPRSAFAVDPLRRHAWGASRRSPCGHAGAHPGPSSDGPPTLAHRVMQPKCITDEPDAGRREVCIAAPSPLHIPARASEPRKELTQTMRNLFIGLLVVAALVVGGGIIAQTAYQAGLSTAVTTAAASAPAGTVVTPVAPVPYPYYYGGWGWGWGHGFPFLGFIGFFLFLFLIFGVMRAIFWRGRGWGGGRGGWGAGYGYGPGASGPGEYGPGGYGKGGDRDPR